MLDSLNDWQFHQRCAPTRDTRAAEVLAFVQLMGRAFQIDEWFERNRPVELTIAGVEARLAQSSAEYPRGGAVWCISAPRVTPEVLVSVLTGGRLRDSFSISFDRKLPLPELEFFRKSIRLVRPVETSLTDARNDRDLRVYEKRHRFPNFEMPVILCWFHFFGAELVSAIGGEEYCLKTPVFKVERFLDGLLFQITEERFDNDNPQHREAQMVAMRHLGLDKIEPVPIERVVLPHGSVLSSAEEVTEDLWQLGAEPRRLIERAGQARRLTNRKLWLFTAGCLRRDPEQGEAERMIELLERFADSKVTAAELRGLTAVYLFSEDNAHNPTANGVEVTLNNISQLLDSPFDAAMSTVSGVGLDVSKAKGIDTFEGRLAERNTFGAIVRDIFPNPFRRDAIDENWRTPEVIDLAREIYQSRSFDRMDELAAALQAAGCSDEQILSHCHTPDPHYRGCWLIDMLLGKE